MKTVSLALSANQALQLDLTGNYFHLLDTVAGVDIDFMFEGAVLSTARNMEFGFFSRPAKGFNSLSFTSATAQTIKIVVGFGEGGYNRTVGSVSVINNGGAFTEGRVSLTNVNQAIIAANAARRYLLVQNNDATVVMRVTLDGTAATVTNGFRVQPGSVFEIPGFCSTGAVNAIMENATATTNNCEFVSG